jgi:SAM-dependent methyltransferase
MRNVDPATVAGFGDEWSRFDQSSLDPVERQVQFDEYFSLFPWASLSDNAAGFDAGCGTGRWAALVAPRVGRLHCIDASPDALAVARRNLHDLDNVDLAVASVQDLPFADGSMDFGYSIGVLHHVPDTAAALAACVRKLKPGAPLLVYLYYAFDNRPAWFRVLWFAANGVRQVVSRLPNWARYAASQVIAAVLYWPLARTARLLERLHLRAANFPLYAYRQRSFYSMRTDALDKFGTRLERRFTRPQIEAMMIAAGLTRIAFREGTPYWCAIGYCV